MFVRVKSQLKRHLHVQILILSIFRIILLACWLLRTNIIILLYRILLKLVCFELVSLPYSELLKCHSNKVNISASFYYLVNCLIIMIFFFCCSHGMWKFPGQRSNPSHSSYLTHSKDNTESLTTRPSGSSYKI